MLDSPTTAGYQGTSKSCRNVLIQSTNSDFLIILKRNTFHFKIVRTSPLSLAVAVELAVFQASKSALNMTIRSRFPGFFLNSEIHRQKLEIHLYVPYNESLSVIFIEKSQEFSFNYFAECNYNFPSVLYHRIAAWWGLRGTSGDRPVQPPARAVFDT